MLTFEHKGFGRLFVADESKIPDVIKIMRDIDEYEVDGYMPKDLVAPFSDYPNVVYVHKFADIDMGEVIERCWKQGIYVLMCNGGYSENSDPRFTYHINRRR